MKKKMDIEGSDFQELQGVVRPHQIIELSGKGFDNVILSETGKGIEKPADEAPADFEEAISACGYGKFHRILALILVPMCCSQLFSSGTVSFILPTAECDLQLTDFQKGNLNAAVYGGNIVAGLVWAAFADVLGRRKILIMGFLLDGAVSLLSAFSTSFWMLMVLKVMSGIVISGPNGVMYAYLAETHEDSHRPQAIIWTGMFFALAQVVQPIVAYLVIPLDFRVPLVEGFLDLTSWRVFLLVCALPSLISGLVFVPLPESPKFLMSKNRPEEALAIFRRIYAFNTGKPASEYPITSLATACAPPKEEIAPANRTWMDSVRGGWRQFSPLFHKPYLNRLALMVALQFSVMICINSIRLWTPQLFAQLDAFDQLEEKPRASTVCDMISATLTGKPAATCKPVSENVYLRSVLIGSLTTVSFIATGKIMRRFGKRNVVLFCFPMAAACALALIWATNADAFMGLIAVFTPLMGNALTVLSAFNVDVFPTSIRSIAVSFTITCGRIASLSGNLILPILLSWSCQGVFFTVSGSIGICFLLTFLLPKGPTETEQFGVNQNTSSTKSDATQSKDNP